MKKLGVVITDGVGYRNFVLSDFLVEAEQSFDEVVLLSFLPKSVYSDKYRVIELDAYQEPFTSWFFRKFKEVAHLQLHKKNNFGIQDGLNVNYSRSKNARGFATRFIFKLTSVFNSERWIQLANRFQEFTFKNNAITQSNLELLQKEQFDLLFFTHQRPPYLATLVLAAKKCQLKTASFIFSWDNLASKGRMAAAFDYYLVWSDLMKKELLQFYTNVKSESIHVVGTPQFEPYVLDRYKSSKADFYQMFDLDASKKTICFSCGDISTSKNDELYITTIANFILKNEIEDVNFIVRTSPAEDPKRFNQFVTDFPFIKWNYPKWNLSRQGHQEQWSQRIPSVQDVIELRALLEYSDLNINMLSTMSLDFILFDKPVINTVFGNASNGLYDDQRFLEYVHIKHVVDSKATRIAKNENELLQAIKICLAQPFLDQEHRQYLKNLQITHSLEHTGKRIAQSLYTVS